MEKEKEANEPQEEEKATTNIQLDIPRNLFHLLSILFISLYSVCFLSCCHVAPHLASPRGISNVVSTTFARLVYAAWIKAFLRMLSGTLFRDLRVRSKDERIEPETLYSARETVPAIPFQNRPETSARTHFRFVVERFRRYRFLADLFALFGGCILDV